MPLRVFLCHDSADKKQVRALSKRLARDGFAAWLDMEKILPGQEWEREIEKAIKTSHVFVVCFSAASVSRSGYTQTEIALAMDVSASKSSGVFVIPVRLSVCDIPPEFSKWQHVDLFDENGYKKLQLTLESYKMSVGEELGEFLSPTKTGNWYNDLSNTIPPVVMLIGASFVGIVCVILFLIVLIAFAIYSHFSPQ